MILANELQKIGLSDKEAKVYLANLELGQSSVQNIAKKSGVNRATTYVVLNSLIQKGLCSTFDQGKKTFYTASDPEALQGIFEIQKKEIEEKQKYFQNIISQLHLIDNRQADKPVVKFFEGKQGLINCFIEFTNQYKSDKEDGVYRLAYPADKLAELFTDDEIKKFRAYRMGKDITVEALYNSKHESIPDTPNSTGVKIPSGEYPLECDIGIYGDCVRILSMGKKPSGILITDKGIATTLKTLFELAWQNAKQKKNQHIE